jgi:hypothetical protein
MGLSSTSCSTTIQDLVRHSYGEARRTRASGCSFSPAHPLHCRYQQSIGLCGQPSKQTRSSWQSTPVGFRLALCAASSRRPSLHKTLRHMHAKEAHIEPTIKNYCTASDEGEIIFTSSVSEQDDRPRIIEAPNDPRFRLHEEVHNIVKHTLKPLIDWEKDSLFYDSLRNQAQTWQVHHLFQSTELQNKGAFPSHWRLARE